MVTLRCRRILRSHIAVIILEVNEYVIHPLKDSSVVSQESMSWVGFVVEQRYIDSVKLLYSI